VDEIRYIDVLSDSTGETAEKVVRAALLQFPKSGAQIRLHTRIRTPEQARAVLERAAQQRALVVFTVVSTELRELVHSLTAELKVEALDVIGSLIGKLGTFLDREPINVPSGMLPLSDEYFRRIESVEFAVKSDDGKDPRNFRKADLILVGVSRTSKTPLSLILAQRGLKVANLPLVLGVSLPYEIREVPPEKVMGLTIGIEQLCEIRQARLKQLGMPSETNYGMREHVREELDYAAALFKEHKWPVVDVTGRAIEETAVIVLEKMKERGESAGPNSRG
jgi:regulator of PEP synthase PpsR (kinase-PPPase family)